MIHPRHALFCGVSLGVGIGLVLAGAILAFGDTNPNALIFLSLPFSLISAVIASFAPVRPR